MRLAVAVLFVAVLSTRAEEPNIVIKPDAFQTLVNPNCSHCIDESKRRKDELKDDDRVLCWTRGKYDGGAIPYRFFLNPYRVISDSYGVFVYDPDAGYARGFPASYDFTFHGWRNGVMVMKHKDGTLYSCLSGIAFAGPRKGEKLPSWPTIVADWGWYLKNYPGGVAYHMYEKYKPVELPSKTNEDSNKSRGKPDGRLPADEMVLGIAPYGHAKAGAIRLHDLEKAGKFTAWNYKSGANDCVVLWQSSTRTAAAYFSGAEKRDKTSKLSEEGKLLETKPVRLEADGKSSSAPFVDKTTGSRFDVAGRGIEGELKGWTLTPLDSVMVKWFAWSAEYPDAEIQELKVSTNNEPKHKADDAIKEVVGASEFLRAVPKKFAICESVDVKSNRVRLLIDGEKEPKDWPVEPDAEVKILGWWGRLEQLSRQRVWVWFKTDRQKAPVSVMMIADEISEQDIHGDGLLVKEGESGSINYSPTKGPEGKFAITAATQFNRGKELENTQSPPKAGSRIFVQTDGKNALLVLDTDAFEARRTHQREWLRKRWLEEGLPATVTFAHVTGEADLMLDHEAMRWARTLKTGDKVKLMATPPINAVVKSVQAWRERTQVRIVVNGLDLVELSSGKRMFLLMDPPSASVDADVYPPGIDAIRDKKERIEWFLANIYCTCKIAGDNCTGHFYTLASCNPNGCGSPNMTREKIAAKIDAGLSNRQIFDDLKAERGAKLLRQHLAP